MIQVGRGGFSSVWRPRSFAPGEEPYVIKKPRQGTSRQMRQKIVHKYGTQKVLLDRLHATVPAASPLFNKVREIRGDGSVVMSDLGDTSLVAVLRNQYFQLFADIENVWQQLKEGTLAMLLSGIVHRDIKIDNIMARKDAATGRYRVAYVDFADGTTRERIRTLNDFKIAGTTVYMSPELLRRRHELRQERLKNKQATLKPGPWKEYVANDLWALGMVLYLLIYNKHPKTMFEQRHQNLKPEAQTPITFYDLMRRRPDLYKDVFPRPENASPQLLSLINEAEMLLSIDPNTRLRWLRQTLQSMRQRRRAMTERTTRQTQQQQRPSKRTKKTEESGISMLLRAAAETQEKKK